MATSNFAIWANNYTSTFRSTKAKSIVQNLKRNQAIWRPLKGGVYKIKTDAAYSPIYFDAGLGIIIWNHRGQIVAAATKYLEYALTIDEAEAIVARKGLKLVIDAGIFPF